MKKTLSKSAPSSPREGSGCSGHETAFEYHALKAVKEESKSTSEMDDINAIIERRVRENREK